MKFDKEGRELPDPTPIEIPAGFKRPETLQEQIRRLVRTAISERAVDSGAESFEEANDFDMDDDDPTDQDTVYTRMAEEVPRELRDAEDDDAGSEDRSSRRARDGAPGGDSRATEEHADSDAPRGSDLRSERGSGPAAESDLGGREGHESVRPQNPADRGKGARETRKPVTR